MNPQDLSSKYQPDLDTELRRIVGDSSLPLYHMMRYHLGWVEASGEPKPAKGGKLLRPGMCLLACEAAGGDWRKALPAAAALELLHNFTLIHDDVEDNSTERRGTPTVWHVWGLPQGINTGDAMHVLARLALLRLEERGGEPRIVLRAARLLDETCLRLCEGQYLDISFEERLDIGTEEYVRMIAGKTAALFGCSIKMGALLATDDGRTIEGLGRFGRSLGLAFQVQDDILGIWGKDKVTGKSSASDILQKKKSLPIVYAIQTAQGASGRELARIYSQERIPESDVPRVLEILDDEGTRAYVDGVADRYRDEAIAELKKTDIPHEYKEHFKSLAGFIVGREY